MSTADSESTAADHGSSPALRAQEKWEYDVLPIGGMTAIDQQQRLRARGLDGWELICVCVPNYVERPSVHLNGLHAYFKRRMKPNEPRGLSAADEPCSEGVNNVG